MNTKDFCMPWNSRHEKERGGPVYCCGRTSEIHVFYLFIFFVKKARYLFLAFVGSASVSTKLGEAGTHMHVLQCTHGFSREGTGG